VAAGLPGIAGEALCRVPVSTVDPQLTIIGLADGAAEHILKAV
jgi:hypothetical protein